MVKSVSSRVDSYFFKGRVAGPVTTSPKVLNSEPWLLHKEIPFWNELTEAPECVQLLEKTTTSFSESLKSSKPAESIAFPEVTTELPIVCNGTNDSFVKSKIKEIMEKKMNPREYFLKNYGIQNSGKKFRDFVVSIDPSFSKYKQLRFSIS